MSSTITRVRGVQSKFLMAVLAVVSAVLVGLVFALEPGLGLALVMALGGAALAVSRPDITVLVLIAYIPFENWLLKFVPDGSFVLLVPDVMSLALLLAVALKIASSGDIRWVSKRYVAWIAGGLAAVTLASSLANPVPMIDQVYWVRVSLRFVPVGLVAAIEPWSGWIRARLATVAFPVALAQCSIGLVELLGGMRIATFFWAGTAFSLAGFDPGGDVLATVEDRIVAGTMGHYNQYAFVLLLLMGIMITDLLSRRVRQSGAVLGGWAVVGLSAVMIVLSQSRQNVIALAFCMVAFALMAWFRGAPSQRRMAGVGLGVLLVLALVAAASGRLAISERFGTIANASYWEDAQQADRGYAVTVIAPTALRANLLLGAGPGSFHPAGGNAGNSSGVSRFDLDTWHSRFVHDVGWAHFAAQLGLLGVLIVGTLGVLLLMGVRAEPGPDALMYVWTAVAFVTTMFGSNPLIYKPNSIILWCIFGLAAASIWTARERVEEDTGGVEAA